MLRPKWETDWISLCDGKRFFPFLHSRFEVKISPIKLKVRIKERLEYEKDEEWVVVDSFLKDALKSWLTFILGFPSIEAL